MPSRGDAEDGGRPSPPGDAPASPPRAPDALQPTLDWSATNPSGRSYLPTEAFLAGDVVAGNFRIEKKLGAGGMGVVYLAHDLRLRRDVALKIHRDSQGVDRLQREATAMARLQHPNVIAVHEVGSIGGRLFIAMEYVDGLTLRDWLQARTRGWREIVTMLVGAGRGLAAAHEAGLVHRDFKPDNILIGKDGRPRVGDFGLARAATSSMTLPPAGPQAAAEASTLDLGGGKGDAAGAAAPGGGSSTATADLGPVAVAHAADAAAGLEATAAAPATPQPAARSGGAAAASIAAAGAAAPRTPPAMAPGAATPRTPAERPRTPSGRTPSGRTPSARTPSGRSRLPARTGADSLEQRLTVTGAVLGTPAYMAPEQFLGAEVDARADQFGFCVVLYEALYRERPFAGQTALELVQSIGRGDIRPTPPRAQVPRWVRDVMRRGLARDPPARWSGMAELLTALEQDPAARRRRWATALAGAVAVACGAAALGFFLARSADGPRCDGEAAALDAVWNPGRRRALEQVFAATGLPQAKDQAARTAQVIDDYAGRWRQQRIAVCESGKVKRTWSPELLDRGVACLGLRLDALGGVLDSLGSVDASTVGAAARSVTGLPAIQPCGDADYLLAQVKPPEDPATAQRVAELEARLVALQSLLDTNVVSSVPELDSIAAEAKKLGYAPLEARVMRMRAMLARRAGDFETAKKLLGEAFYAARGSRDDAATAAAAAALVSLVGYDQGQLDAAEEWTRHALAEVAQAPHTDDAARVYQAVGMLAELRGDGAGALEYQKRALAIIERTHGTGSAEYADALNRIGTALDIGGKTVEAIGKLEKSLEILESVYGPDSPELEPVLTNLSLAHGGIGHTAAAVKLARRASALVETWAPTSAQRRGHARLNLGVALLNDDQAKEARVVLEESLALLQPLLGAEHADIGLVTNDLGLAAQKLGDDAAALAYYQRALAINEKALGPDHPELAVNLGNVAGVLRRTKRCRDAIPLLDRAVALTTRRDPDHPQAAYPLLVLGQCRLDLHQERAAVAPLERALALREKAGVEGAAIGETRWYLALAIVKSGGDRARARALLEAARPSLAAAGSSLVRDVDAVLAGLDK